ncbi:MAG: GntR family transcriptional regulator, partial [Candidatus Rokubacteria bacterium]|nr:GntR family transcriptional regulator [Candidatus Rokubacteria bacterium]
HVHESRNPRVARVLTELGLMRQQGEGIPRMIEEMELSWLPPPGFSTEAREFVVVLRNEPIFQGADESWTRYVRNLPLEVGQRRALVAFWNRAFTNGDYQELNRVERDRAYRELADLEKRGLVEARGATRGREYVVRRLEVPTAPTVGDAMAQLVARMDEVGHVTNADYRDIFGVGRMQARKALARLVADGVLEMRGERRGAHYVPGAKWPPAE